MMETKPDNVQRENLVIALGRLLRTVKIHQDNNKAVLQSAAHFVTLVTELVSDEDGLQLEVSQGRFYVQGEKLLQRRKSIGIYQFLATYFELLTIAGVRFSRTTHYFSHEEILTFARCFNRAIEKPHPLAWLEKHLTPEEFPWLEILHQAEVNAATPPTEKKAWARRVYSHAYDAVKEVSHKISSGKAAGARKAVRVAQDLAENVLKKDSVLVGLATIRDFDDYTYTHSVNVAILSMCLGRRIGLSRKPLVRLGVCGLFHDLGKVDVAREILNKPGRLNPKEFKEIQKHSINSVRQILKIEASPKLKAQIILAPFEHHLKFDLSGYPAKGWTHPVSLFGRILTLADVFDALTSPRVYRPSAMSPDRALGLMSEGVGKEFDPVLFKWFVDMIGLYPAGTLVQLDTGELGLVIDTPSDSEQERPRIILVNQDADGKYQKGDVVRLSAKVSDSDRYQRNIVSTHHPSEFGIQPAAFLL